MKINNIKTVSAKATRIGKSKKESICVDGDVYIKSCNVGLWNFLVVCELDDINYMSNKVEGRKSCVSTKHRCEYSARLSIEASINNNRKFKKDTGYDLKAKYKTLKIDRG